MSFFGRLSWREFELQKTYEQLKIGERVSSPKARDQRMACAYTVRTLKEFALWFLVSLKRAPSASASFLLQLPGFLQEPTAYFQPMLLEPH